MIKNLVLRILCFMVIFTIASGLYLIITNLSDIGEFIVNIPNMLGTLFTALPINYLTLLVGLIIWEGLATIFPRVKKDKKQK